MEMDKNEVFRDDPDELAELEKMLNNTKQTRVIDKPMDATTVETQTRNIDFTNLEKSGSLHTEVKDSVRKKPTQIDLSKIKINPNQNEIDKEDNIKKALFASKSDFAGIAVQSGYGFTVLPLVKDDAMTLLYTSKPHAEYRQAVLDVIYSKIKSFSIGMRMTKNDWMQLTTVEDLESILYALYCATYPTQGKMSMECPNCDHEFEFQINNASLVKINDKKIAQRMKDVSTVKSIDDMKKYTLINQTESHCLPDCGIIFTLRTPTLQNNIDILRSVDLEVLNRNSHSLTDSLYIESVLIPVEGAEHYDVIDNREEILRIINNLSIDDSSDLRDLITKRTALNRIIHTIKNVKCPKCQYITKETALSLEDLLFTYLYDKFRE